VQCLALALGEGAAPRLTLLDVHYNGCGEAGATALAEALRRGGCPALEELNIIGNQVGG
jgi:hypothetical protein